MYRIIIDYPDDCTELDAVQHAIGCFTPCQNDYKRLLEGHSNGVGLHFGNGREGYFYRTSHGNYVLKLKEKE